MLTINVKCCDCAQIWNKVGEIKKILLKNYPCQYGQNELIQKDPIL